MVKNTSGGSKTKSQARRLQVAPTVLSVLRVSKTSMEKYAIVIKNYGQGNCLVKTEDGFELRCVIRGAFRGRSRGSNFVNVGSMLLVGMREWESSSSPKICDLLEVYSAEEEARLRSMPEIPISRLFPDMRSAGTVSDDLLTFSNDVPTAISFLTQPQKLPAAISEEEVVDEIDIDDI